MVPRFRILCTSCLLFLLAGPLQLSGQTADPPSSRPTEPFYFTSGVEYLFSFADVRYRSVEDGSALRFAPVINLQSFFHYDLNAYSGLLTGMAIRNVGFIYDIPDSDIRKKFRTYNIGIPFGLKLGRMDRTFIYGGYEVEIPIHFKEKTFVGGDKEEKTTSWFSDRVNPIQSSFFLGVQLPYSLNLRFKYYFTEFLNRDFSEVQDGVEFRPYEDLEAHVFYLSISFYPFRNDNLRIE